MRDVCDCGRVEENDSKACVSPSQTDNFPLVINKLVFGIYENDILGKTCNYFIQNLRFSLIN